MPSVGRLRLRPGTLMPREDCFIYYYHFYCLLSNMNSADFNLHCHDEGARILTLSLQDYQGYESPAGQKLIVGLHPWDTEEDDMFDCFSILSEAICDPRVVAIGEVGIDPLHGASVERQEHLLEYMLFAACMARLPVVFHIVRRYDILMKMFRAFKPTASWAVHGFRAKPDVVKQLADAGIYMSVGLKFNPESVKLIPRRLLLLETDELPDSEMPRVVEAVAQARGVSRNALVADVKENLRRFLASGQKSEKVENNLEN